MLDKELTSQPLRITTIFKADCPLSLSLSSAGVKLSCQSLRKYTSLTTCAKKSTSNYRLIVKQCISTDLVMFYQRLLGMKLDMQHCDATLYLRYVKICLLKNCNFLL